MADYCHPVSCALGMAETSCLCGQKSKLYDKDFGLPSRIATRVVVSGAAFPPTAHGNGILFIIEIASVYLALRVCLSSVARQSGGVCFLFRGLFLSLPSAFK